MKTYAPRQLQRLLKKYQTKKTAVPLADGVCLQITEVEDAYALFDRMVMQEARGVPGERFPYWAEVWPASVALARWLNAAQLVPPATGAKELGCGIGVVGVALARLGWRVEATDFVETALALASLNARDNHVAHCHRVAYLDWRHPVGEAVECLVAADVVYEKKNHAYLLGVLRHLLLPGGRFYLSDPGRPLAQHFVALLEEHGYEHQREVEPVQWKGQEHLVDIYAFTKPRES